MQQRGCEDEVLSTRAWWESLSMFSTITISIEQVVIVHVELLYDDDSPDANKL